MAEAVVKQQSEEIEKANKLVISHLRPGFLVAFSLRMVSISNFGPKRLNVEFLLCTIYT